MARKQRQRRRTNEAQPDCYTLDAALEYCQEHGLLLIWEPSLQGDLVVTVWSGKRKIPIGIRRTIYRHRSQPGIMFTHDVNICIEPEAHCRKWRKARNGTQWCAICKRLDASIRPETDGRQLSA